MLQKIRPSWIGQNPEDGGRAHHQHDGGDGQSHADAGHQTAPSLLRKDIFQFRARVQQGHSLLYAHGQSRPDHDDQNGKPDEAEQRQGKTEPAHDSETCHENAHDPVGFRRPFVQPPENEGLHAQPCQGEKKREWIEIQQHHADKQGYEHGPERGTARKIRLVKGMQIPGHVHLPPAQTHGAERGDNLVHFAVGPCREVQRQPQRQPECAVAHDAPPYFAHHGGRSGRGPVQHGKKRQQRREQNKHAYQNQHPRAGSLGNFRTQAQGEHFPHGTRLFQFVIPVRGVQQLARSGKVIIAPQ